MAKNRTQWTEQEGMMATAYGNIADSFAYICKYMKTHLNTMKNGMGVVTGGDLEEALDMLKQMINKNLHNVSQMRVNISMTPIKPVASTASVPSKTPSSWVSTSTNGNNYQFESKKPSKNRISESRLKDIVAESVKKILKETYNPYTDGEGLSITWFCKKCVVCGRAFVCSSVCSSVRSFAVRRSFVGRSQI